MRDYATVLHNVTRDRPRRYHQISRPHPITHGDLEEDNADQDSGRTKAAFIRIRQQTISGQAERNKKTAKFSLPVNRINGCGLLDHKPLRIPGLDHAS